MVKLATASLCPQLALLGLPEVRCPSQAMLSRTLLLSLSVLGFVVVQGGKGQWGAGCQAP